MTYRNHSARSKLRRTALLPLAWLAACIELPDLPRANEVDRPRALAIVAEPPETLPGDPVQLSAMLADLDASQLSWFVCAEYFSFSGGNQYGDGSTGEGCSDEDFPIGKGERAILPGELSALLFDNLELAQEVLGAALPEGAIDLIREQVGLPLLVEARLQHEGRMIRATKRVLVSERPQRNTNPPPPQLMIDGQMIVSDEQDAFVCTRQDGEPVRVEPASEVALAPVVDGEMEPWLEPYRVIDARGELKDREETAFYSWYGTGGEIRPRVSMAPDRDATWQTPREPGCHRVWLIVRDGNGGASACGMNVAVGDAAACE